MADGWGGRQVMLALGLAFAVTLAVIVGQRLTTEALAVVVGVMAGVAASVPTSLIVAWLAARTFAERQAAGPRAAAAPEPETRIVVVTAPAAPAGPSLAPVQYPTSAGFAPAGVPPRHFTLIGSSGPERDEAAAYRTPPQAPWPR